ncbi:hypothetical protein HU200_005222 [Digitaria exilis]|uniref:Uncharacterized protein n=1 Tax=Digitaria exilis TaxID=1010633 RepID=A0A835FTF8_9POAL|nr:hypothetical protein HU200_005222 [Digitaria exilis]
MLLRAHTLGIARVLFEDPPAGDVGDDAAAQAAAKKWARDDALCRGLAATSSPRSPTACSRTTHASPRRVTCGAPLRAPTTWKPRSTAPGRRTISSTPSPSTEE